jgi:hypothetical protein
MLREVWHDEALQTQPRHRAPRSAASVRHGRRIGCHIVPWVFRRHDWDIFRLIGRDRVVSLFPTQACPQSGVLTPSSVPSDHSDGYTARQGADPGSFSSRTRTIPTLSPSPSAHILNHLSPYRGPEPSGSPDPALSPGGDGKRQPKGSDSRSPKTKPGRGKKALPAPDSEDDGGHEQHQTGRATAERTDTGCIGSPTLSCGDLSASDGQEVRLGVPISQLLEIYELLRPILSDGPPAAPKARQGSGEPAGAGETD